jgi:hypothetical protein
VYSKPLPNLTCDEVLGKERGSEGKEDQRMMDEGKLREYSIEYL